MRALSIRQPYAEQIPSTYSGQALRGTKTIEYRSRPTRIIGERFYLYAAKKWSVVSGQWPEGGELPTGVIVGTAIISHCTNGGPGYEWHLTNVKRLDHPRKPKGMPQPVWFKPF